MRFMKRYFLVIQIILILLAGCSQPLPATEAIPTRPAKITPYRTSTPAPTSTPLPTRRATIPVTPAPTATPFTHVIKKDDTMLGIALLYDVKLEELLASNPEIDPHWMTVGETLVIPLQTADPTEVSTPTPVPVSLADPVCYKTTDGGVWCFIEAVNERKKAIENLSVQVGLFSPSGKSLASDTAIAPVNHVRPGQAVPLVVFFPPPIGEEFSTQSALLTSIEIDETAGRYLDASGQISENTIDPGGLSAHITGTVILPEDSPPPRIIWVAAVAYDQDGHIAGVRKWDSSSIDGCQLAEIQQEAPGGSPEPDQGLHPNCMNFDLTVYSLGPEIDHIELLVEARP